ncbi:hypothetical protein NQZ68_015143 [Dissostichus eleginoides]|nr:hypothetical protein NQZ68_015143 [Dissostichus eleginoides]
MKGTKRVKHNHSQAHSDPSRDPSPGIPLPGRPSPGFSSPQDHDSGSSCPTHWDTESLSSVDFSEDHCPGSPQPTTSHKHTHYLLLPPLLPPTKTSSPLALGSGSSCPTHWDPESHSSADFSEDLCPGSPQPTTRSPPRVEVVKEAITC